MARRDDPENFRNSGKESSGPLQEPVKLSAAEMARRRQVVEAAYSAEYPRLHRMMVAQLCRKTGQKSSTCQDRVEEALQETFVRLMRLLSEFDPDHPAGPWVRSVAYIVLLEQSPGRRPREEARAGDLHADGMAGLEPAIRAKAPDPTEDFFGRVAVAEMRLLAERLGPDKRDAVVLTVFEELSAAEAAARLGVSVDTIHVRKSRGLSDLRNLINEKGEGPNGRDGTP